MTPIWLLDVDGVLNARPGGTGKGWPSDVFVKTKQRDDSNGRLWSIHAARPVLDFIRGVHEEGLVEIRWHTTWQAGANKIGKALNLPKFPIVEAPEFNGWRLHDHQGGWWKVPASMRTLDEGRPVIWTDDDLSVPHMLPMIQHQELVAHAPGCLLIRPDSSYGLTAGHLDTIRGVLESFQ